MRLSKIISYSRYSELAAYYRNKGCLCNDYLQNEAESLITDGKLYEFCSGKNAFLFQEKDGFYRVYYYLNDLSAIEDFNSGDYNVEILFRNDLESIGKEISYFEKSGFRKNTIRDQYSLVSGKASISNEIQIRVRCAENIREIEQACNIFNKSFDKLSGDYIPTEDYASLLQDGAILVAEDNTGKFVGAVHQTINNGIAYLAHIAVVEDMRGKGIGGQMLDCFVSRNESAEIKRYILWVRRNNTAAVKMYQKKGFKFVGKSSLSMIKTI